MDPHEVAAHARERLGMEIQSVSRNQVVTQQDRALTTWNLMTEHGRFWLVEQTGVVEIFRAARSGASRAHPTDGVSAVEAVRRFLELHPSQDGAARMDDGRDGSDHPILVCERCGSEFRRYPGTRLDLGRLCKRCRRAAAERLRYLTDPEHRARQHARSARYYQRKRERG